MKYGIIIATLLLIFLSIVTPVSATESSGKLSSGSENLKGLTSKQNPTAKDRQFNRDRDELQSIGESINKSVSEKVTKPKEPGPLQVKLGRESAEVRVRLK